MAASNRPGHILPQDTAPGDANDEVISGQAVSFSEVADLLYGDDRPVEQRIDRLRELGEEGRARAAGEIADDDARGLLDQIEDAIASLEGKSSRPGEPGMLTEDDRDHRETLAPDSDELEEIEEADEASLRELDGWDGNDPDEGTREPN